MTASEKAAKGVLHWGRGWWLGRRPRKWTEADHLKTPTARVRGEIGLRELATAVGAYVEALRREEAKARQASTSTRKRATREGRR